MPNPLLRKKSQNRLLKRHSKLFKKLKSNIKSWKRIVKPLRRKWNLTAKILLRLKSKSQRLRKLKGKLWQNLRSSSVNPSLQNKILRKPLRSPKLKLRKKMSKEKNNSNFTNKRWQKSKKNTLDKLRKPNWLWQMN